MGRSKWKGPHLETKNVGKLVVVKRNLEITLRLVGQTVWVHNGKSLTKILINEDMIGFKVGEFAPTRADFRFKKKRKKRKNKNIWVKKQILFLCRSVRKKIGKVTMLKKKAETLELF